MWDTLYASYADTEGKYLQGVPHISGENLTS